MHILAIFLSLPLLISIAFGKDGKDNATNRFQADDLGPKTSIRGESLLRKKDDENYDYNDSIVETDNDMRDEGFVVYLRSYSVMFGPETYPGLIVNDRTAVTAKINDPMTNMVACTQKQNDCVPVTKMMEKNGFMFWKVNLPHISKLNFKSRLGIPKNLDDCRSNKNFVELQKDETKDETSFTCIPTCDHGGVIFCKGELVGMMLSPRNDNHGQIFDINHLVRMLPKKEGGKAVQAKSGKSNPPAKGTRLQSRSSKDNNTTSFAITLQPMFPVINLLFYRFL